MKKMENVKKGINIDVVGIFTILFLILGIIFNVYFCQSFLGFRK